MKTLTIAIATAATAAIAPAAFAEDFSFDYTYSTHDVQTVEGAAEVLSDLEKKVERHCAANVSMKNLKARSAVKACVNETMANTISATASPTLAAAYSEQQSQG